MLNTIAAWKLRSNPLSVAHRQSLLLDFSSFAYVGT